MSDKVYCDRNLCTQNEYNGIGCDECMVNAKDQLNTDDTISRKAVLEVLTKNKVHFVDMVKITSDIKDLPSVTPKERFGHWTQTGECGFRCSECGKIQYADDINELNFCCNCGSENSVRKESE